jgi:hypothetical protein
MKRLFSKETVTILACTVLAASAGRLAAQQTNCLPGEIEKYAAKASSRSDVNLDRNMLGFAGNFLNSKNTDESQAKQIMRGLNAIVVHDYEFDQPGEYSQSDLQSIRDQYKGADWSHIVSEREQGKNKSAEASDIWMHIVNGKAVGMVILSAEEKELSFVCIDGTLDPSMLSHLSGQFGIPQVSAPSSTGAKKLVDGDDGGNQ